jgi:tetratricopeptide (TPR) repeat protein
LAELEAVLDQLCQATPHALLVGIGLATNAPWTNDPRTQLEEVRGALVRRGFPDSNITIAFAPSKLELLASFEGLISRAGDNPTFFLFLGPGFDNTEIWISSADAADSHVSNVSLSTLRTIAARCPNLTSAIWILQKYGQRDRQDPLARASNLPGLGATTIVASPAPGRDIGGIVRWDPPEILDLIRTLGHPDAAASAEQWIALANHPRGVSVRGDGATPLFANRTAHRRALQLVHSIECAPLHRTIQLLEKLAQQREHAAESLLNRAVVRAALGRRKEALEDINLAINQHRLEMTAQGVDVEDVPGVVKWGMAHYYRGKILLHEGRYAEAEVALAVAARQLPTFARAHYFRARAIRSLIEADLEKLARDSAHRYIALGAPLGSEGLDASWQSQPGFSRRKPK